MKKTFVFFLLITVFFSCKKNRPLFEPTYNGEASAIKNGTPWDARVYGSEITEDTVQFWITSFSENGIRVGLMSFSAIPRRLGTVTLSVNPYDSITYFHNLIIPAVSYSPLYDDGHVSGATYKLLSASPDNHFEITAVNDAERTISGVFDLSFEYDDRHANIVDFSQPDTFHFTNGEFSFKLK